MSHMSDGDSGGVAMTTAIRLTEPQIRDQLSQLTGWQLKGVQISKQYQFKDFIEAMAFVNRVAGFAEQADHHPDITIHYNRVIMTLSTHSAGGLTEKDFALARQIEGAV